MFTPLRPGGPPAGAAAPQAGASAAVKSLVGDTPSGGGNGGSPVTHAFNGLSNLNSDTLNGFPITPPDQGLCVGQDATLAGAPKAVWDPTNPAAGDEPGRNPAPAGREPGHPVPGPLRRG